MDSELSNEGRGGYDAARYHQEEKKGGRNFYCIPVKESAPLFCISKGMGIQEGERMVRQLRIEYEGAILSRD
jgi:hypothetical protein